MEFDRICVVGLGYIGLPTAAVIASRGVEVVGVDINTSIVEKVNHGQVPIEEPDLDSILQSVVNTGKLCASTTPEVADAFILAVPTPFNEHKQADLFAIHSAAESIAPFLKKGDVVILESTSPVGTTEQLAKWLAELRDDLIFPHQASEVPDVYVAYCPERVLPGQILRELVDNDRIIGGLTQYGSEKAKALYQLFVRGDIKTAPVRTAEMVKLAENTYRDVNIAFANEMSMICDELGVDVWEVIKLANCHPRVDILQPGPGVGGHCIAVDPWFIVSSAPKTSRLIRCAREVNDNKPDFVVQKVLQQVKNINTPKIACLGLSFKANVDDLRESPAVQIVTLLAEHKLELLVVEPHVERLPTNLSRHFNVKQCSVAEAIEQANTILLLVNHEQFRNIDLSNLEDKLLIDTRGFFL